MAEWQPIETAPLDGTAVDLWIETDRGAWRMPDCRWITPDRDRPLDAPCWCSYERDDSEPFRDAWQCFDGKITNWMPLPEPPDEKT